jgi:NAD(P)-dependent dehydrogenase (short-subunit alcohol dehydrogenase family)
MKIMKRQRGGRIINIGSISAQMPRPGAAPYAASKFGLAGLAKTAALEGRDHGVIVSCIHPGNVLTERRRASSAPQDQEPMMSPADLAGAVVAMAALPPGVNFFDAIILPTTQAYLGRG